MLTCLLWLPRSPLAALQSNLSQQADHQYADRHHYHQWCFLYFNADDDDHCQNCPWMSKLSKKIIKVFRNWIVQLSIFSKVVKNFKKKSKFVKESLLVEWQLKTFEIWKLNNNLQYYETVPAGNSEPQWGIQECPAFLNRVELNISEKINRVEFNRFIILYAYANIGEYMNRVDLNQFIIQYAYVKISEYMIE